jgi:hypothetical protein
MTFLSISPIATQSLGRGKGEGVISLFFGCGYAVVVIYILFSKKGNEN